MMEILLMDMCLLLGLQNKFLGIYCELGKLKNETKLHRVSQQYNNVVKTSTLLLTDTVLC